MHYYDHTPQNSYQEPATPMLSWLARHMDGEGPSPVNPFLYWKGRLHSDGTQEGIRVETPQDGSAKDQTGHDGAALKLRDVIVSSLQPHKEGSSHDSSKRRPPPSRPDGPISRAGTVSKDQQPDSGLDHHGSIEPPGVQERISKLAEQSNRGLGGVQNRPEKVRKPSAEAEANKQGRAFGKPSGMDASFQRELEGIRRLAGKNVELQSSRDGADKQGRSIGRLGGDDGGFYPEGTRKLAGRSKELQSSMVTAGVQERISRLQTGSDADSYTPTFKKLPMHAAGHKQVKKSTSSPIVGEETVSPRRMLKEIKSSGSLDSPPTPSKKYIPTIQTIRASTGDQFSVDDMELYLPQKSTTAPSHQSGMVLEFAKKIDSALLGAQLPMTVAARRRRGSGGDFPTRARRGSSGEVWSSDGVSYSVVCMNGSPNSVTQWSGIIFSFTTRFFSVVI